MQKLRNVCLTGRILTPNRLRSPLTGRPGAAFHLSFTPPDGGAPVSRIVGDAVVVQGPAGGILIELAAARILVLPQEQPRSLPENPDAEFLRFLGMKFVESPLLQGARVHLVAPVFLDSAHRPWTWVACARFGSVVLTVLH
jgi:hypothetical protein